MKAKELLPQQAITANGLMPSLELVEIIQRLVRNQQALEERIEALEGPPDMIEDIDGGAP